jgi:uncharacterized protein DUF4238
VNTVGPGAITRPKRQHFVPRGYLDRFANEHMVIVRRRDSKTFTTNTTNVAVECGFYDIAADHDRKNSSVEFLLADWDNDALAALHEVDRTGKPPSSGSADRAALAIFLALQGTRTPEQRERVEFASRVVKYANGREVNPDLVAEFLEKVHLRAKPSAKEVLAAHEFVSLDVSWGASTPQFAIDLMLKSALGMAPLLSGLWWTLEFDRKDLLTTSDTPLVIWRAPTPRDAYEGVGIMTAEELRIPLDPSKQLVLTRRQRTETARITPHRSRMCNQDHADACHHFILGNPKAEASLGAVSLKPHRPVLRFNKGPLFTVSAEGKRIKEGEVLHAWIQRRA